MRLTSFGTCLILVGALLLGLLPGDSARLSAALASPPSGTASFLGMAALGNSALLPAVVPPAPGAPPATSVLPHSDAICSTEVLPGAPLDCSVFPATSGASCSAHCDSAQQCSVFGTIGFNGPISRCSVIGRDSGRCSILQPPATPAGETFCSATDGELQSNSCSTYDAGGNRPACSAQNPGADTNFCSAFNMSSGSAPQCSVMSSAAGRQFCSTGFAGAKQCSARALSSCSIHPFAVGVCTALKGAPLGSCSNMTATGHCSIMNGPKGTRCHLP